MAVNSPRPSFTSFSASDLGSEDLGVECIVALSSPKPIWLVDSTSARILGEIKFENAASVNGDCVSVAAMLARIWRASHGFFSSAYVGSCALLLSTTALISFPTLRQTPVDPGFGGEVAGMEVVLLGCLVRLRWEKFPPRLEAAGLHSSPVRRHSKHDNPFSRELLQR